MSPSIASSIVVAGVSGSGKTTIGTRLAERLNRPFVDGDDLHPEANREKMRRGEALDDHDRDPWLAAVGAWLAEHPGGVVACSALRRAYRDRLRQDAPDLVVLALGGSRELLESRVQHRHGHFMPASLLDSQLATWEPLDDDEAGARIELHEDASVDDTVARCVEAVGGAV